MNIAGKANKEKKRTGQKISNKQYLPKTQIVMFYRYMGQNCKFMPW